MAFSYDYSRQKNTKNALIIAISAVLVFSFYLISSNTGYIAYKKGLENELNMTKNNLSAVEGEKAQCLKDLFEKIGAYDNCNAVLGKKAASLTDCEIDRTGMKANISSISASLNTCISDKQSLNALYSNSSENFRELVKNSVASICCSFRDVQRGAVAGWSISNNTIVCEGNPNDASSMRLSTYTVNCGSGITSY